MGQKTVIEFYDDITGEQLDQDDVVREQFEFEGTRYALEGSQATVDEFKSILAPYAEKATKVDATRRTARKASTSPKVDSVAVRKWCEQQGIEVNDRGRIPNAIIQQYLDATQ